MRAVHAKLVLATSLRRQLEQHGRVFAAAAPAAAPLLIPILGSLLPVLDVVATGAEDSEAGGGGATADTAEQGPTGKSNGVNKLS